MIDRDGGVKCLIWLYGELKSEHLRCTCTLEVQHMNEMTNSEFINNNACYKHKIRSILFTQTLPL